MIERPRRPTGRCSRTASSSTARAARCRKSLGNVDRAAEGRRTRSAPRSCACGSRATDYSGELVDRRRDPEARGRGLPPHPQHAALPARQHSPTSIRRSDAVPVAEMARDRPLRARPLQRAQLRRHGASPAHYERYEFHPVVAEAADVLLGRPGRLLPRHPEGPPLHRRRRRRTARRSAQTALWHITHACCADGADPVVHRRGSVGGAADGRTTASSSRPGTPFPQVPDARGAARALAGDPRARALEVQKELEMLRDGGQDRLVAAGEVEIRATGERYDALAVVRRRPALRAHHLAGDGARKPRMRPRRDRQATPSPHAKCERCWHYRADVGADPAHPTICGRCVANLFGAGEPRRLPDADDACRVRALARGRGRRSSLLDQVDEGAGAGVARAGRADRR